MLAVALIVTGACAHAAKPKTPQAQPPAPQLASSSTAAILPAPAQLTDLPGDGLPINAQTVVVSASTDPGAVRVAEALALLLKRATGIAVPVKTGPAAAADGRIPSITLILDPEAAIGDEGYQLVTAAPAATLKARTPAGLSYGVQTIRQLLPYWSEYEAVMFQQPRPAALPAVNIVDAPRYAWRGAMLDVARHFFTLEDVERFIDIMALHKMNRLHLHLADDQGWRIEISKWPDLTAKGALTQVGGGRGGSYTQAQFAALVSYAADRFITIVPEIDMPGHTNAALASYGELNCDGRAKPVFTGTDVGFSALCVDKDVTYRFIDDVVGEIGALAKGPYFHVGGDEVKTLTAAQYKSFVERVQSIVQAHGLQMIGWDEVAATSLAPASIVQHWRPDAAKADLARAPHLILSPADRAYLDMKYDRDTALGLNWAALIPVRSAYEWDPAAIVPGAPAAAILGVEAPIWSETTASMRDVEFLMMPRLAAIAEVAWSPQAARPWDTFRARLGAQAPRWTALGINFYRSPDVPWKGMDAPR